MPLPMIAMSVVIVEPSVCEVMQGQPFAEPVVIP